MKTWAQTFVIVGAIMLSCFLQLENASHHAKWSRMYLSDLDNKLAGIEEDFISVEHEIRKNSDLLLKIKEESCKSRGFLESIEFKMRQKDQDEYVKTQFANGKIGRK